MKKFVVSFLFLFILEGCSFLGSNNYEQQLKSPCVGVEGSPCAHNPINTWLDPTIYQEVYNQQKDM